MATKLDDATVKTLPRPEKGSVITYDTEVKGFGCRVTKAGARSFVLNYRTRLGQERRYTIGQFPDWGVKAARKEAQDLKRRIDSHEGFDPLGALEEQRKALRADRELPTVDQLCDRFEEIHLPRLRPSSARDYKAVIKRYIRPEMGALKVRDVSFADVEKLHRTVSKKAPTQANRVASVLSKMFTFAARTRPYDPEKGQDPPDVMRPDGSNPVQGLERNQERKRHRYLSADEIRRLGEALDAYEDRPAVRIIRLLMLTGARKMEVLSATWGQFDLANRIWTKPGSTTKQKTDHRVPLSEAAAQLLQDMRAEAGEPEAADYLFPARTGGHRIDIKKEWLDLCIAAGMVSEGDEGDGPRYRPTARVHDLRHTYASLLVSSGHSLPIIGALLGHSQQSTTQRYAHLFDDPLRAATERVGAVVMPVGVGG